MLKLHAIDARDRTSALSHSDVINHCIKRLLSVECCRQIGHVVYVRNRQFCLSLPNTKRELNYCSQASSITLHNAEIISNRSLTGELNSLEGAGHFGTIRILGNSYIFDKYPYFIAPKLLTSMHSKRVSSTSGRSSTSRSLMPRSASGAAV